MNSVIQSRPAASVFLGVFCLSCFGLSPAMEALTPAPDGGYPGGNTAEGQNALASLTSGTYNTAVGFDALFTNDTAFFNTALGAGTLLGNTGSENTAVGAAALLSNTTGGGNTAVGSDALATNGAGGGNTATGQDALTNNNAGNSNTAIGADALLANTSGSNNTAAGVNALDHNMTGSGNIALGFAAGENVTSASNVICIGASVPGSNTSNTCFIGNIFGVTSSGGASVLVNSNGKLGTVPSSQRFKDNIKPMDHASEVLYALTPVTFQYKKEIDPATISQFGLVAEDVEKVDPDLIVRDRDGKPYSVRYDQVNAMLLNEFLKEHRKVEQLEKQIEVLNASLQKLNAQIEVSKAAPQTVLNSR